MIFDNNYDESLWCMVKANKKTRKQIIELLKELPKEIYWHARTMIIKRQNNLIKSPDETYLKYTSPDNPDIEYSFILRGDEMVITKNINNERTFELTLDPMNSKVENYHTNTYLGSISTNFEKNEDGSIKSDNYNFDICSLVYGHYITYSKEICHGEREISLARPITLKRIPRDLYINDL